jgi:hypothetical protein
MKRAVAFGVVLLVVASLAALGYKIGFLVAGWGKRASARCASLTSRDCAAIGSARGGAGH